MIVVELFLTPKDPGSNPVTSIKLNTYLPYVNWIKKTKLRGFHAPTSFFVVCRVLQWWLSWQSGLFRYHRSVVRIQSSSNFITEHCQLFWTDKNKEKEAGNDPILTSFFVAVLFSSYSRRGQGFESRRMSNLKTFIFNLFLCVRLRVKKVRFLSQTFVH